MRACSDIFIKTSISRSKIALPAAGEQSER